MVGSGRSNQQIASSMTVTVNTIKWYLKNIYTKLGATNRTEATSIARREGLLVSRFHLSGPAGRARSDRGWRRDRRSDRAGPTVVRPLPSVTPVSPPGQETVEMTAQPAAVNTVLFDLDGTLTDSARGILDCFVHALDVVGAPRPDEQALRGVLGPPLVHSFAQLGLDEVRIGRARAAYRARYDTQGWAQNAVYPGIPELLDRVTASGVTLGVATSKNERMARRILRHFDLDGHFTFIGGASDDESRTEKSDVIAHTLEQLGRPSVPTDGGSPSVLMIGDRSHDVIGAARFGIPAVLVGWGYGTPAEHRAARWSVSTSDELGDLLDQLVAGATVA